MSRYKLFVASHTPFSGGEIWLVARVIDTADKEQVKRVKADIKNVLSWRVPDEPEYNKDRDVMYGPFTGEYGLSEDAYKRILDNYPDGEITPKTRWLDALNDIGVTNERGHFFAMNEEV